MPIIAAFGAKQVFHNQVFHNEAVRTDSEGSQVESTLKCIRLCIRLFGYNALKPLVLLAFLGKDGPPREIRTPDTQVRSLVLYPAELWADGMRILT